MRQAIFFLLSMCWSSALLASGAGGCSCCRAPGDLSAPHGGTLQSTGDHRFVEVIADRQQVMMYLLDHDLEILPIDNVNVMGKIRLPRRGKTPVTLEFRRQYSSFVASLDLDQRVHRYVLDLVIKSPTGTKKVQFQVEPDA